MAILEANKLEKKTAFILCSESAVCQSILRELKERGWYVFELNEKDCSESKVIKSVEEIRNTVSCLDLLIIGDDEELFGLDIFRDKSSWQKAKEKYEQNINLSLLVIHHLLPLMDSGGKKRICYVNTRDSSNNLCYDSEDYLSHMIGAARNMQAAILKNRLEEEGYTFRIYSYNKNRQESFKGASAVDYFLEGRSVDRGSSKHTDENRLVMRDEEGRELPW